MTTLVKFLKLKKPLKKPLKRRRKVFSPNAWTYEDCVILASKYFLVSKVEMQKLLGGRSHSAIVKKVSQLKHRGWVFS